VKPYAELPGLEGVYLEDSFVREIVDEPDFVRFVLLVALLPGHPWYERPEPKEPHCYRVATLTFPNVRGRTWLQRGSIAFTDADGAVDHGNVDVMGAEGGRYRIEGEWGALVVRSDPPELRVHHPEPHERRHRRRAYAAWLEGRRDG
jgi:hypothetical protein